MSEGEMGMLITGKRLGELEEGTCGGDEGGYVPGLLGGKRLILADDVRRKKDDTRFYSLQQ